MNFVYKVPLILFIYSITITVLLSIGVYFNEERDFEKLIAREIQLRGSRSQVTLQSILSGIDLNMEFEVQRELSWINGETEIYCAFLTDVNHQILYSSQIDAKKQPAAVISKYYDENVANKVRKINTPLFVPTQVQRITGLYYPINIKKPDYFHATDASYVLFIAFDANFRHAIFHWHYIKEIGFIFLIIIASSLFLTIFLHKNVSSRISKLIKLTKEFEKSNYKARVSVKGNDDLTKLNQSLHQMAIGIEERKSALIQQNKLYNALAETNQIIVQAKDHHELFHKVCNALIKHVPFSNVWVVFYHNERPQANEHPEVISADNLCQCPHSFNITFSELENGSSGLVSKVWNFKRQLILNQYNPEFIPLGTGKSKVCATSSVALFPLFRSNQLMGVLILCAQDLFFFSEERLKLCEKIVADLCFALDNLHLKFYTSYERELHKKIINTIPVMILLNSPHKSNLSSNEEFQRVIGFKPEENWGKFYEIAQLFDRAEEEIGWHDYKLLSCYGEVIDTSWALINLPDETRVAIGIDLTERKKSEQAIKHLAYYDPLTNLPNRRYWSEFASEKFFFQKDSIIKSLAVLCLDLDRFKIINDTRGHDAGDNLLIQVAERLKLCVNASTFLARLGGDEFSLLLLNAKEPEAIVVAKQIIQFLAEPFVFDKYEIKIGVSIGIACAPKHGKQLDVLYKCADIAMYYAKQECLGYAFFEEHLAKKIEEDFYLEQALEYALKHNELYLVYQPRVNLIDEKVTSVEALLRWKHPERGEIPPDIFILLAEQSHIIYDIDDFVLRAACNQIKSWKNNGIDLRLAINLSVRAFQRDNLFERIQNILLETGVKGESLEIEITETAALYDLNLACKLLLKIKELGIHLSVDDFGTGYSSLNYLKSLPVDSLKIDCSLIKDVEKTDSMNHKIVPSILFIARNFGLKVVAEGVETIEQQQFLKHLGCESVQGFYYSKGIPAHELEQLAIQFNWFKV